MSKNDLFALWKAEYLRPENAHFTVYGEAPGKSERLMPAFHWGHGDFVDRTPYDLFLVSAKPGETRWETKRRLHAENYAMGKSDYFRAFTVKAPPKPVLPRTKREKEIAARAAEAAYEHGRVDGTREGRAAGREEERQRSEKFLLDVVLAQARGHSK